MDSDDLPPADSSDALIQRTSRNYGWAQSAIFVLFAVLFFLSPRAYLFHSAASDLAGNVLCTVGILIIVLAFVALRDTIQIAPQPKAGKELVHSGVYRYLRHPIYTGILLCVVGLFLRQATIWVALGVLVIIAFLTVKVRFEERLLQQSYPEYAEYRTRAWGLFPGVRW